jgi:hypothetical protein
MIHRVQITLLTAILVGLLLAGCGPVTVLEYTVPDNYEGFLVIRYECPGGTAAEQRDGRTTIRFENNGVACVRQRYRDIYPAGISHTARIQTTSGREVEYIVPGSPPQSGQGLLEGGLTTTTYGPTGDEPPAFIYSVLWLGKASVLDSLQKDGTYTTKEAEFLERSIGKPQNPSKGLPYPTQGSVENPTTR